MTRTDDRQANNVMNNPSQTPPNKLYRHHSIHNVAINHPTYRSQNKDREVDKFSSNKIDDGRWNSNNSIHKKRKEPHPLLKSNMLLHQHPPFPQGFLLTPYCTPPDKYLLRSRLLEVKEVPSNLTNGSQWDQLSCSMWKKFLMHRQTEETYKKKISLWKFLFMHIKSQYPRHGLYLVGSTLTGFAMSNSDVDMCLIARYSDVFDPRRVALIHLTDIHCLLTSFDNISKVELIQAKVPILKFRDVSRGLEVDLNCNNSVGIRNTHLLFCYSQLDWRVRPLIIVVKLWAHFHDINDAKNMTISSYSLTLMVIHFLQHCVKPAVLPCLHTEFPEKFSNTIEISKIDIHEELDPYYSLNNMSIGELLVKFFNYYANFNYSRNAISVRMGSVIPIETCRQVRTSKNDPHQWKYLCIEEPFDLANTARSVYDPAIFERILRIFRRTSITLNENLTLDCIFKPIPFT